MSESRSLPASWLWPGRLQRALPRELSRETLLALVQRLAGAPLTEGDPAAIDSVLIRPAPTEHSAVLAGWAPCSYARWHTCRNLLEEQPELSLAAARKVFLSVQDSLSRELTETYPRDRVVVRYARSGRHAVTPHSSGEEVVEPRSDPREQIGVLPGGDAPAYVRRIAFWCERALELFVRDLGMKMPEDPFYVCVVDEYMPPSPSMFGVGPRLPEEYLAAYVSHEIFHVLQFSLLREPHGVGSQRGAGALSWKDALFEGGAVLAEDAVVDRLNRYLLEADSPLGDGLLARPDQPVTVGYGYKSSLFWRYVVERATSPPGAPQLRWSMFGKILEETRANSLSSGVRAALERVLPGLPFAEPTYLDPVTRDDLLIGSTLLGDFALACYLTRVARPDQVADQRFRFGERGEGIHYLSAFTGDEFSYTYARPAELTCQPGLAAGGVVFSGNQVPLGRHFFELAIADGFEAVEVSLRTTHVGGRPLFFMIVFGANGDVVDIISTDRSVFRRRLGVAIAGGRMSRLGFVLTAFEAESPFTVSVSPVNVAPDLMITRWNCEGGAEFETDPRVAGPSWSSPDIWIQGGSGPGDTRPVVAGRKNTLCVRLRNRARCEARGVSVRVDVQDAGLGNGGPPVLRSDAWRALGEGREWPGEVGGIVIGAILSTTVEIPWSPPLEWAGRRLCLRVVAWVPEDPNKDNKRALSLVQCVAPGHAGTG